MKIQTFKVLLISTTLSVILAKLIYTTGYNNGFNKGFDSGVYEVECWGYKK